MSVLYEKYDLSRSPFARKPTHAEVAELLGETKSDLKRLIDYKEHFIERRTIQAGKKVRNLAYPVSRYRRVHERLKFHLNKVKQPNYLFSPRKGRSPRDNATVHLDQQQFLTLDLKQFYPSTTKEMVFRWFSSDLGMYDDVARTMADLSTIDGVVSLGSPLTPVLCSLVHRVMFDQISEICSTRGLNHSVWVDDLTISGRFVSGSLLNEIRNVIRSCHLRSHKIKYRNGNRPAYITGIGVVGPELVAPNSLNLKIKTLWENLSDAHTTNEKDNCIQQLLANLGTVSYISGASSIAGQRAANKMNMLRQQRRKLWADHTNSLQKDTILRNLLSPKDETDVPFDMPLV